MTFKTGLKDRSESFNATIVCSDQSAAVRLNAISASELQHEMDVRGMKLKFQMKKFKYDKFQADVAIYRSK